MRHELANYLSVSTGVDKQNLLMILQNYQSNKQVVKNLSILSTTHIVVDFIGHTCHTNIEHAQF